MKTAPPPGGVRLQKNGRSLLNDAKAMLGNEDARPDWAPQSNPRLTLVPPSWQHDALLATQGEYRSSRSYVAKSIATWITFSSRAAPSPHHPFHSRLAKEHRLVTRIVHIHATHDISDCQVFVHFRVGQCTPSRLSKRQRGVVFRLGLAVRITKVRASEQNS